MHAMLFSNGLEQKRDSSPVDFVCPLPGNPRKELKVYDLRHFEHPAALRLDAAPGEISLPANFKAMLATHGVVWIKQKPLFGVGFEGYTRACAAAAAIRNGRQTADNMAQREASKKLIHELFGSDYDSIIYREKGPFVRERRLLHAPLLHADHGPEEHVFFEQYCRFFGLPPAQYKLDKLKIVNEWQPLTASPQKPLVLGSHTLTEVPYSKLTGGVWTFADAPIEHHLYLYLSNMTLEDKLVFIQFDKANTVHMGRVPHGAVEHPSHPQPTVDVKDLTPLERFDHEANFRYSIEVRDLVAPKKST